MSSPSPTPTNWKQQYGPLIMRVAKYAAVALLGALLAWLELPPEKIEIVKEVIEFVEAEPSINPDANRDGVTPDADASDRDARLATFRSFADTPAGQVGDIPKEVFLWQAETKLTGKPAPAKDQNPAGSCVGFGNTTACERSLAADIVFRKGHPSEFTHFSEEFTYAVGKVQGARALGASVSRQDGSASVFVKAAFEAGYGLVPKGKYGDIDLTEYSSSRAQSWNTSGPPRELLEASKKYPVKSAAKVTSWEQAKKALASGYAIAMDSWLSFAGKRDANGIAAETREGWSHCLTVDGYCVIDGREYGHVENHWSDIPDRSGKRTGVAAHTGPVGPGNPSTAGFWALSSVLDRGFRNGGSYALSGVTGFPARKLPPLDWALAPRVRQNGVLALNQPLRGGLQCEFSLSP